MNLSRAQRLLCTVVGLVLATAAGAGTPDTAVPPPAHGPGVAVLLYIEGDPVPGLEADVAGLRGAALEMVTAMVSASGRPLADRPQTEELVRRFRVRSGSALEPSFLAALHDDLQAGTLVAVTLLVGNGRFTATGRAIDCGSGVLTSARIAEAPVTVGQWQHALRDALRDALPSLTLSPGHGRPLLVLPGTGIGLDALTTRQAATALIVAAVQDTTWRVIDPALAAGTALANGRDLTRLDREGRALLAEKFGVSRVVEAEVVSFGRDGSAGLAAARLDVEDAGVGTSPTGDVTMTWRLLDLGTGRIRAADTVMVPGSPRSGWFGLTHTPTLLEQMRRGAEQLWPNLQRLLEEPTS